MNISELLKKKDFMMFLRTNSFINSVGIWIYLLYNLYKLIQLRLEVFLWIKNQMLPI